MNDLDNILSKLEGFSFDHHDLYLANVERDEFVKYLRWTTEELIRVRNANSATEALSICKSIINRIKVDCRTVTTTKFIKGDVIMTATGTVIPELFLRRSDGVNRTIKELTALAERNGEMKLTRFKKSSDQNKINGGKAGKAQFEKNYGAFERWVKSVRFPIDQYCDIAQAKFSKVVESWPTEQGRNHPKFDGSKDSKTLDNYRKEYLKRHPA